MKLTRTFRIPYTKELKELLENSKNLYNQSLYVINKQYEKDGTFINYGSMDKLMKGVTNLEGEVNYRLLPAQVAQQNLRLLEKNYKSYFKLIKDWKKNPTKYKAIPKPPKYLKGDKHLVVFPNQTSKIKENRTIKLSKIDKPIIIPKGVWTQYMLKHNQIRLLPRRTFIKVEIIYESPELNENLDVNKWVSLDIGLNNLATLASNVNDSLIFDGKPLKSINQYYNKKMAKLQSVKDLEGLKYQYTNKQDKLKQKREDKIHDYMHKISKKIIRYCVKNKIGTLIIGKNKGWKQEINLGKKFNQKFVQIPFDKLLSLLDYKGQMVGLKVVYQEESYTSKADALALDSIPTYKKGDKAYHRFSGKRVKRGLYQSSVGVLLNADVNGALNIARKYLGKLFELPSRGLLLNPVRIRVELC